MYRKLKRVIKKNKLLFSFLNNIMNYRSVKSEKNYDNIVSKIIEGNVIVKAKLYLESSKLIFVQIF